jgi:hypothetical protein
MSASNSNLSDRTPRRFLQIGSRLGMGLVLLAATTLQTACGTLLYPERRGQDSGRIDPAVVLLDAIGLFFFVIPGLIAFAVDFATGAIYLPPGEAAGSDQDARVVHVDPKNLTRQKLAQVIKKHTGKDVTLTERDMRVLRQQNADAAREKVAEYDASK